jgi:hypothetical protein
MDACGPGRRRTGYNHGSEGRMRRCRGLPVAVLAALLALTPARAGPPSGDDFARARAEFEKLALAGWLSDRGPRGPSLTAIARSILARDPVLVRSVEAEAFEASKRPDRFAAEHRGGIENAIRFLHGMDRLRVAQVHEFGEASGFDLVAGAVVMRQSTSARSRCPRICAAADTSSPTGARSAPQSPGSRRRRSCGSSRSGPFEPAARRAGRWYVPLMRSAGIATASILLAGTALAGDEIARMGTWRKLPPSARQVVLQMRWTALAWP